MRRPTASTSSRIAATWASVSAFLSRIASHGLPMTMKLDPSAAPSVSGVRCINLGPNTAKLYAASKLYDFVLALTQRKQNFQVLQIYFHVRVIPTVARSLICFVRPCHGNISYIFKKFFFFMPPSPLPPFFNSPPPHTHAHPLLQNQSSL